MGYNTWYDLSFELDSKVFDEKRIRALADELNRMDVFYGVSARVILSSPKHNGVYSVSLSEDAKWYDHDDDMILLSTRFPDVLFTLHGDGEDGDDFWYAYYRDGMTQFCRGEIVYPDFDEKLMEEYDLNEGKVKYSYES